ncbi:MAG: endonuclease [Clostridia bacterium]|nr:endonuclease [Clostridia bacterium]
MDQQKIEILEKIITVMLNSKFKDDIPTEDDIRTYAAEGRKSWPVADEEFEQVIKNIHASCRVAMDRGVCIVDEDTDHQSWLPTRRAEIDFYYWSRYMKYLEVVKGWNTKVISALDIVSDEIMDLLGNPANTKPWKRRGLVLGDVQSGKTANYTAIINKAADAGYKVIILLAGTLESLRRQTQERLDSDFVGRESKSVLSRDIRNIYNGVGKLNSSRCAMTFTSGIKDFNATILNNLGLDLKGCSEPAIFVVKKNKNILQNLDRWLRVFNADANGVIDLPLLLIDDESDNASINTNDGDNSPTAINAAIRLILNRFSKSTYLGVTATPFANIFINPDNTNDLVGDDLFPSDFIYALSPPTNYVGCNAIFGDEPTHNSCLEKVDDAEDYFPLKHKSSLAVYDIPGSLEDALMYFVLANAVRDYRGHTKTHRSMLINISRFTSVQDQIEDYIKTWLQRTRSDIQNFSKLPVRNALKNGTMAYLNRIWDKYEFKKMSGASWELIQREYLHNAVMPIEARAVNQRTGAASLDYDTHKENGFRVIAIGGNSLSRGLTLEGLCVSYFYRNSQMYDTLLQMGRWFGYREGYDDVFKIWMSQEAIDWYSYITMATNELRGEIKKMNKLKMKPIDFGLKVRDNPDSLIVTARNKMRSAQSLECWVSVNGKLLETPRLKSKLQDLDSNEKVFRGFINNLDAIGKRTNSNRNETLWMDVPKEVVIDLLRSFITHPWHLAFNSVSLADFIEGSSHLSSWDVAIPNGSCDEVEFDGVNEKIVVKPEERAVIERDGAILISGTKVRVGTLGCTKAGLSEEEIVKATEAFKIENPDRTYPPDNAYLIEGRKPLLLLHILKPKPQQGSSERYPDLGCRLLYALGVGFPRYDSKVKEEKVKYVINLVEFRNWFALDEEDDDVND